MSKLRKNTILVGNLDLTLLRKQKRHLLKAINNDAVSIPEKESLEGILNLIDNIQDQLVAEGIATERQVFGWRKL